MDTQGSFGLTVGLAFLALAGVALWRGREIPLIVFATAGVILVLAGLIFPTRLGPIQAAWMRMAHVIARFTTPVFMGAVYFLILTPTGILMRAIGRDPLKRHGKTESLWVDHGPPSDLDRQF